ncbi:MAG TPA: ATP-binding cassette domain-containing protein, partial [Acetobacteraceae bacterium]
MLEIADLAVSYGGLRALQGVSLTVAAGQFVTVVGPNGAGKTTLFKAICGVVPVAAGRITFEGRDLLRLPASRRA